MEQQKPYIPLTEFCYANEKNEYDCLRETFRCFPSAIRNYCIDNVVYYSTSIFMIGSRLSREVCETKEIIILSDKIFPLMFNHSDTATRFFIFVVFHETAHALLKHKCKIYDSITGERNELQEQEAHALAFEWYNSFGKNNGLTILKKTEIDAYEQIINQHIENSLEIQKKCLAKRIKQNMR